MRDDESFRLMLYRGSNFKLNHISLSLVVRLFRIQLKRPLSFCDYVIKRKSVIYEALRAYFHLNRHQQYRSRAWLKRIVNGGDLICDKLFSFGNVRLMSRRMVCKDYDSIIIDVCLLLSTVI